MNYDDAPSLFCFSLLEITDIPQLIELLEGVHFLPAEYRLGFSACVEVNETHADSERVPFEKEFSPSAIMMGSE